MLAPVSEGERAGEDLTGLGEAAFLRGEESRDAGSDFIGGEATGEVAPLLWKEVLRLLAAARLGGGDLTGSGSTSISAVSLRSRIKLYKE